MAVNCAGLPEALIEAELFGIERGVATGVERRVGRLESASGGTLFLDEIGDLSPTAQAKLLRALQEKEVEWIGGRKPFPVDIRLVAATNKDLKEEIEAGRFRQGLYFRLNVVHLDMPSLKEIRGDTPLLAAHCLRLYGPELASAAKGFAPEAMQALSLYEWPGNVRELENEVKRILVLSSGDLIQVDDLSDPIREEKLSTGLGEVLLAAGAGKGKPLKERVTALEIQMIRGAMSQTDGDRRRAAKLLGVSHQGLINKLKRYGLE